MAVEPAVHPARELRQDRIFTVSATLIGVGIGLVLCVLNIIVTFKTGASFGGSALVALLGAGLLQLLGRLTWPRLFIVFSVASSGYFATAAFDSAVAAMYLTTGHVAATGVLLAAAAGANVAGIALGVVLAELFVRRESLPYPTLKPAITFMGQLAGGDGTSLRLLCWSAVAAAAVAGAASWSGHGTVPLYPGAPAYAAIAVSPLLVGTGALVGVRATGWMLVGAVFSMAMWAASGLAAPPPYAVHLASRWILPVGVGIMVGYAVATLIRTRAQLRAALADVAGRVGRRTRVAVAAGLAACALAALAVWGWRAAHWLLLGALILVVTFVFALFLCRAGGEIGIAPLSPVLYLSVVIFALTAGVSTALLVAAATSCAGIATVYYTYAEKVATAEPGDRRHIRRAHIIGSQAVGGLTGAVAGVLAILAVIRSHALSSSAFPAPLASSVSFLTRVAVHHGIADLLIGAAAATGGGLLALTKALPTSIGLGVLLPPAYVLTIAVGGGLQWLVMRHHPERKSIVDTSAAGLVIGEGVIVACTVAVHAL